MTPSRSARNVVALQIAKIFGDENRIKQMKADFEAQAAARSYNDGHLISDSVESDIATSSLHHMQDKKGGIRCCKY